MQYRFVFLLFYYFHLVFLIFAFQELVFMTNSNSFHQKVYLKYSSTSTPGAIPHRLSLPLTFFHRFVLLASNSLLAWRLAWSFRLGRSSIEPIWQHGTLGRRPKEPYRSRIFSVSHIVYEWLVRPPALFNKEMSSSVFTEFLLWLALGHQYRLGTHSRSI